MHSVEDYYSRILYELNRDNLNNIQRLYSVEKKRFTIKNCKIALSYLFNGGFSRIARRFRLNRKNASVFSRYELKEYKRFPDKRVVVYTCIWGKYDEILEPYFANPKIDYVIITDQDVPEESVWKKMSLPDDLDVSRMTGTEINRYCKMLPHKLFSDYDYSIYVDGNVRIVTDMMPVIADMDDYVLGIHDYQVDCIYNMKNAIIAGKRAKRKNANKQIKKYKKESFPKHFGAFECNVLVRKHNDPECIQIMNDWWDEFNNTSSKRDQLSLPYVIWKRGKDRGFVNSLGDDVRMNPRFQVSVYHNLYSMKR